MIYYKICRLNFYSQIDPKNNSYLYLDMTYPPAKFDVDWSKETQVIVKKLKFDARPTTDIPNLITRFMADYSAKWEFYKIINS